LQVLDVFAIRGILFRYAYTHPIQEVSIMKFAKFLDKELSRRDLLIGAGITAIAAATPGFASKAEALGGPTEKWPWPYVKLDPQKTADIAYNEWYRVFCGAAVVNACSASSGRR
jgi:hypothetical protein